MVRVVALALLLTGCDRATGAAAAPSVPPAPPGPVSGSAPSAGPPPPIGPSDVSGRVLHSESGAPLAGALVILRCDGARNVEQSSDDTGGFSFVAVPAEGCALQVLRGTGNVTVQLQREAAKRRGIEVRVDPARKFRFDGRRPAGDTADHVRVPLP